MLEPDSQLRGSTNLLPASFAASLAHSLRIAQILNLHQIDRDQDLFLPALAPHAEWSELEEQRWTWWVIFCSDRFVSGTMGWPPLINERDVRSNTYAFYAHQENTD